HTRFSRDWSSDVCSSDLPAPIGLALLLAALAYFHFFGNRQLRDDTDKGVTPARTQSYFAKSYGIEGEVFELTVSADSPLVGMSRSEERRVGKEGRCAGER